MHILGKRQQLLIFIVLLSLPLFIWTLTTYRSIIESSLKEAPVESVIPAIVHQSWKSYDIPSEIFSNWSQSWKTHNPHYTYVLWNDEDNLNLIQEHYPWFLPTYLAYKQPISRADAARVFYMHKFGGIYADLDVACYKPLDKLLSSHELLLAEMWIPDDPTSWEYKHRIPNAFFGSKPGHSFWMYYAHMMMQVSKDEGTEELAGPVMLWNVLSAYRQSNARYVDTIFIADTGSVFPYSWSFSTNQETRNWCSKQSSSFNETKCREIVDPDNVAYTISYWSHTW
ncbi:nucleotide-diphospho-sugar transferase [Obelidium mucronatum]|nr:nucleotide-diphospho-sugar transferase [Obelidium mucronatum]